MLATVVAMEGVAWASHKYVMHGFAWAWHRDHHEPHDKVLEKNDRFALVGAALSIAMFALGSDGHGRRRWWPGTWIGLGVLGYGIIYTLVHDGLVHQRWFRWVPQARLCAGGWSRRTSCTTRRSASRAASASASSSRAIPAVLKRELAAQDRAGLVQLREAAK